VVLVVGLLVAACSKVETGVENQQAAGNIPGVVRIVGAGTIDSLVPELSSSAASSDAAMFWGGWLFLVNDKGDLEPDLATVVPTKENGGISADGLTITYHLRKGVLWHDGVPFDARDVIFSYHVVMNPANNVVSRTGFDQIADMTAPDPFTVKVRLKRPYAPAAAMFFAPSLTPYCILPEHLLKDLPNINHAPYNLKPVGTGPFMAVKWEQSVGLSMVANPHYWRGAPKLKRIDYLVVSNSGTRTIMMQTGEADLYSDPQVNQLPELEAITKAVTLHTLFNEVYYITFNTTHPPLDDVHVRRALAGAIDKQYVIRTILHGAGTPAVGPQPPYLYTYDANVAAPAFDPKGAAVALGSSGWTPGPDGIRVKNGKRLSLVYAYDGEASDGQRIGAILQNELHGIGVELELKPIAHSIIYAAKAAGGILSNGKFDLAYEGWLGGVDPDDDALWGCDQRGNYNHSFICDPRIEEQERIALTHYDIPTRKAAYRRIQELLAEDMPVVFLWWQYRNDVVSKSLKGYKPAPTVTTFWNSWQWSN
jgi:peptide/nickel transport system substrate-binding protein